MSDKARLESCALGRCGAKKKMARVFLGQSLEVNRISAFKPKKKGEVTWFAGRRSVVAVAVAVEEGFFFFF